MTEADLKAAITTATNTIIDLGNTVRYQQELLDSARRAILELDDDGHFTNLVRLLEID